MLVITTVFIKTLLIKGSYQFEKIFHIRATLVIRFNDVMSFSFKICQTGQSCCYKGSNGIGGCFQADSQRCCPDGLICDAGETCCNGFCGKDDCTKS